MTFLDSNGFEQSPVRWGGFIIEPIEVDDGREDERFTHWTLAIRRVGSPKILAVVESVADGRNRINEMIANEEGGPA